MVKRLKMFSPLNTFCFKMFCRLNIYYYLCTQKPQNDCIWNHLLDAISTGCRQSTLTSCEA